MIDLHTHSTASDGFLTPLEILKKALQLGLEALALTDHDAVSGLKELESVSFDKKIEIINGAELSVYYPRTDMEIIALDIPQKNLNAFLDYQQKEMETREILAHKRIDILNKKGFQISYEEVAFDEKGRKRTQIRRPHFADILLKKGYISSIDEAYKGIFAKGGSCFVETRPKPVKEVISFIKENGAKAILAHPIHTKHSGQKLFELICELKRYGLDGLEVFHSSHPLEERIAYLKIIKELKLISGGGSDFHGGTAHPENALGFGRNNNLNIPFMVLEGLRLQKSPSRSYYEDLKKYL